MKYLNFFIIILFLLITSAKAENCDYKEQEKLNKEVQNIKISYEILEQKLPENLKYYANGIIDENGNDVTDIYKDYFIGNYAKITINNIPQNFYIVIEDENISFMNNNLEYIFYSNTKDGSIDLNVYNLEKYKTYKFLINSVKEGCEKIKFNSIKVTIPRYNELSDLDLCKDIKDYTYCQKFIKTNLSSTSLLNKINNYKKVLKKEEKKLKDKKSFFTFQNIIIFSLAFLLSILIFVIIKFFVRSKL